MGGKPRKPPQPPPIPDEENVGPDLLESFSRMPASEAGELTILFLAAATIGDFMSESYRMTEKDGNLFGVRIIKLLKDKGFAVIRDRRKD